MNKWSKRSFLILLLYVIAAFLLTLVVIWQQTRPDTPVSPEPMEKGKSSDRLQPHEFYFIDRNYPNTGSEKDFFQQKLRQSIAHDKATRRSHRGLEHPWTIEGPGNLGGRVNTIAVHPTDPEIMMIGYSQGGIYRTSDGGQNWIPVFDDQASLSISHIIFDPHDPDRAWATTGDVNISGYPFLGSGVYRSDDGGQTWTYVGLQGTGVLSKIAVAPDNPDILFAGSMGYPSQKGNERGFFRSTDQGNTWQKTLHIDDSTGVIDMVVDPLTAGRVFVSAWTRIRSEKISTTLGPGTGLFRSDDYGQTWVNIKNGLPEDVHSRTSIEITEDGTLFISYIGTVNDGGECHGYKESLQGIYRSDDAGGSWELIPTSPFQGVPCEAFGGFGWYFEALKVNPQNPLDMFLLGVDLYRTVDGGFSWFEATPVWWTYEVHADKHDLVFAHNQLFLGTDGGAYATDINQASEWVDIENIPSTQFYRATWNPHTPDQYYGGAQDNGTTGGNASFINEWPRILGGDGFQPLFDPTDPDRMYAMTQNGNVYWSQNKGLDFTRINRGLQGTRYWDMPLIMSPHDPKILYCGSHSVYRIDMRDTMPEWKPLSTDLTRGDSILGGRYPAITALAQSELDPNILYAGTQDGLIWATLDGGETWTDMTEGSPGFYVTSITCSTINPFGVIATFSGYRDNDHQPYIYRSEYGGLAWAPVDAGLPMMGVNALLILPGSNDGVLIAGTDGGVYVSFDAGSLWERVGTGMPYMPVYDLDYNPVMNTLVAATFSRGIMTFPVEELEVISSSVPHTSTSENPSLRIYPTITSGTLYLETSRSQSTLPYISMTLTDLKGRTLYSYPITFSSLPSSIQMPAHLGDGLYLLHVYGSRSSSVHKVILKREG